MPDFPSITDISWRVRTDAEFEPVAPNEPPEEWNVVANGWTDLLNDRAGDPLNFGTFQTYPEVSSCGGRGQNNAPAIPTRTKTDLGAFSMPFYPEMMHPLFDIMMGTTNKTSTPSPGAAAKASAGIDLLTTLDTQPTGEEVLMFTYTGTLSGVLTGFSIDVLVDGVVMETVVLPDETSLTTTKVAQTKGGYGPTVTFVTSGTASVIDVVVSGVQYWTTVWKVSPKGANGVIEQLGRVEVDAVDSQFATGVICPANTFNWDNNDDNGLLMSAPSVGGNYANAHPKGACSGDAAGNLYRGIAAWMGAITIDGQQDITIQTASLAVNTQDSMVNASTGNQSPAGSTAGYLEVTGDMTMLPLDKTRFDNYLASQPEVWSIVFSTPANVHAAQPWVFQIDMSNVSLEDYVPGSSDMTQSAGVTLRAINNATDGGPIAFTLIDRRGQ